ncbi:TPA: 50S ribosomal protein L10 [Candidatus Ventrenecus avicola]|nr:50S ribosomal protein L10 [Candidatus Ventrenecus avicola]
MASAKNLEIKKDIVSEIENSINNSESVILFQYQGLTVSDLKDLRQQLKGTDATVKVYKNTLLKRALDELNYDFDGFLEGPNAVLFGKNLLEPIKVLADFAKDHDKLEIRVGIINGSVADLATINEYAAIPSREGLLTMLAAGMMEHVRNLSIALNLYAEQKENEN